MTCDERGPDLVARHLGELPPEAARELEAHLADCAPCRAESEELARILDASAELAAPEPSAAAFPGLLAAVAEESRIGSLLTDLALGELDGDARAEAEALVAADPARAAELAGIRTLLEGARSAPQIAPSPQVLARLREAVREAPEGVRPEDGDTDPRGDRIPAPVRRKGRPVRLLRWLVPAAAAAALLVALGLNTEPAPGLHVDSGSLYIRSAGSRAASEDWVDRDTGAVRFEDGDELQAHDGPVRVRVRCDGKEAGAADRSGKPPAGVVDLELGPGARLERLGRREFHLHAGGLSVEAGPFGNSPEKRLTLRHGASAVLVEGTSFVASVVGGRLAVRVESGVVRLVTDADPEGVRLAAGQGGLADGTTARSIEVGPGTGLGGVLAPVLAAELRTAKVARGATLRIGATLSAGPAGAVRIVPFADSDAILAVRLKGPGGVTRTVKLLDSMLRAPDGGTNPRDLRGSTDGLELEPGSPYRMEFDVPDLALEPGTWHMALIYTSYRKQSRGAEWLGVVESEPLELTVTE